MRHDVSLSAREHRTNPGTGWAKPNGNETETAGKHPPFPFLVRSADYLSAKYRTQTEPAVSPPPSAVRMTLRVYGLPDSTFATSM